MDMKPSSKLVWLFWGVLASSAALTAGCDDETSSPHTGGSGGVAGSTASGGSGAGGAGGAGGSGATAGSGGSGGGAGGAACTTGTLVFQSDFEDQDLSDMWVDGNAEISQEQVYEGSYSVVYAFSGAGHFGLTDMTPFREFYAEFWAYLDDMPCVGTCDSAGKHFFRFAWWPNKSGGIQKQIDTGMLSGNVGAWWFDFEPPVTGLNTSYDNAVQSSAWQLVRVAYRPNATGSSDGRFVWMFDDATVIDLTDEFFGDSDELDTFMFTNYDFVPGDGISNPRIFIDNLEVRTGPGAYDCLGAS